jgi:HAD superfamily hydrolase (TIGR01509 family)
MRGAFSSKRHFLFDLDGTLVDSSPAHARAFVEALQENHPALARDFRYPPFAGRPTRDVFLALGVGPGAHLTGLVQRKQQLYRAAMERGEIEVCPGVAACLAKLSQAGRRLFVVTGASRVSAENLLQQGALAGFFEGMITADETPRGKPWPEPYLLALQTYSLAADDCLAIEDGENGARSAQAAGVEPVLVHTDLELAGVANVGDFSRLTALLFA